MVNSCSGRNVVHDEEFETEATLGVAMVIRSSQDSQTRTTFSGEYLEPNLAACTVYIYTECLCIALDNSSIQREAITAVVCKEKNHFNDQCIVPAAFHCSRNGLM
jgi:hypothetical protein